MYLKVYRLVPRELSIDKLARQAHDARGESGFKAVMQAADRQMVYACESSELAAMHSEELLWAPRPRTELLRETILLPQEPGIHATASVEDAWLVDLASRPPRQLCLRMAKECLLSLWIPTTEPGNQHVVMVNVLHPAYERVQVQARSITLVRPILRTRISPDAESVHMSNGVVEYA
ncbi:hypothetical protein ACO2Q9_06925 [Variovorax sp. VNK109]|uniref:hypothetical protein n=1 Tax=Variovorax sp. VNK109 TaxID=3400919 RepID=UPI003C0579FE